MNRTFIKHSLNLFIISGFAALTSCEPDDICLAEEAPFLTVQMRYEDDRTTELKDTVFYQAYNTEGDLIGQGSVLGKSTFNLPIQVTEDKTIKYVLQQGSTYRTRISGTTDYIEHIAKVDEMFVTYDVDNKYDSKACGFGIFFKDATLNTSNEWIIDSEILNSTIDDATSINFVLIAMPRS